MAIINTPNISLNLPSKGEQNWDSLINQNFDKIDNEINNRKNEITTITSQLAEIMPLARKVIFASNYGFTNSTGDGAKLQSLITGVTADILYIDTDILIDVGLTFNVCNIKKIIGLGGTIKLTNKLTSKLPFLNWNNCSNLDFENVTFVGDMSRTIPTDDEWKSTVVSPIYLTNSSNIRITKCTFNNIICAAPIYLMYCSNILIKDNSIYNCWNNPVGDKQGDGVYVGFSSYVSVINNYIKNSFSSKDVLGRIGVTFEFVDTKNCICSNNYIYGYDRAIHIELVGGSILVKNNIIEGCPMAFVGWQNLNSNILVEDNYFSNVDVPTDYVMQMGVTSAGFISIYSNDISIETNANTILKNNTFILEANVPTIQRLLFTKISGESYIDNTFIDKNRNKQMFFYNPNEVTINNNKLVFTGNKLDCDSVYFGHIGKHRINNNIINVNKFTFNCIPTPSTNSINREFKGNTVKNEVNNVFGLVNTDNYLFYYKVSLFCKDNTFIDIKKIDTYNNTIVNAGQDYSSTIYLKSIFDNNTLISTQAGTVTLLFFQTVDNMVHQTVSNKAITTGGVTYLGSGNTNKALIVTASDGTERAITVDTSGVLSATTVQRWK